MFECLRAASRRCGMVYAQVTTPLHVKLKGSRHSRSSSRQNSGTRAMKTTMKKIVSTVAALAVGLSAAGSAAAATWSIQIEGFVSLLCHVDLDGVKQVKP